MSKIKREQVICQAYSEHLSLQLSVQHPHLVVRNFKAHTNSAMPFARTDGGARSIDMQCSAAQRSAALKKISAEIDGVAFQTLNSWLLGGLSCCAKLRIQHVDAPNQGLWRLSKRNMLCSKDLGQLPPETGFKTAGSGAPKLSVVLWVQSRRLRSNWLGWAAIPALCKRYLCGAEDDVVVNAPEVLPRKFRWWTIE
ncbi:hypothetical protein AOQ84DRAFT_54680 [Glonium stellatum]|uniref:Uncharacterized protein n=1 Tax=Glonium stellatum TaxID=574774 RepID=A0A8E2JS54_9PEZI|nr:hypothetical protein AOQ84DRAFT_54680 [Glonium stellatum]